MKSLSLKEKILLSVLGAIFAVISLFTLTYVRYASIIGDKDRIVNNNKTGVVLEDREGRPFFSFYKGRDSTSAQVSQIPDYTKNAFIASEDNEFYSHLGFSPKGILRAFYLNFKSGEVVSGGSTITQQLAKNALFDTNERTITRKVEETILAVLIERKYSKDEVLEMYLNSIYFGEGAYGIRDASQTYFSKEPSRLSLSESAFLAGILSAPSSYSPFNGGLKEANQRKGYVLSEMESLGFINSTERDEALNEILSFKPKPQEIGNKAPHYALMVRDALLEQYGEEKVSRSGLTVRTTLDLDWQEIAEVTVKKHTDNLGDSQINGAVVAVDPGSGEIRALVGSKDWDNERYGKINMAASPRSPGSTFKPIIYSKAFEDRMITPATILRDNPKTFEGGYKPQNYDKKFRGRVPARRALANSLNVPSVEVMEKVGVEEGLTHAKNFGIESLGNPSDYGLSLVLGSGEISLLEMTQAYSVFANQGELKDTHAILQINDKYGNAVYRHESEKKFVISREAAYLVSSILSDKRARQEVFGSVLNIPINAAVKTGTSEFYKDAWTIGYTPNLTVGVWVGKNDAKPMSNIAGSLGAAPIWKELMISFSKFQEAENFKKPDGIVEIAVCGRTASSSAYMEYFIEGTDPDRNCVNTNIASNPSSATPTPEQTEEGSQEEKNAEDTENNNKDKEKRNGPPVGVGGPGTDLTSP